jgi:glycosyltransferase involved in cell wall biosynthesis
MENNVTIVWSFRNRIDVLKKSILSADKTTPKNVNFCLVDAASTDETIKELRDFCNKIDNRIIRICESAYRTSLSEAWNLGMMLSDSRYVIFSSSDVEFISDAWFKVITSTNSEYVLLENHAVFLIDKLSIPSLGWFDEGFLSGPHFDVDYMIRASENNIRFSIIQNLGYYLHGDTEEETISRTTSEVEDRLPMNTLENEEYFMSKWQSGWPGWRNHLNSVHKPHPPTHITQVQRKVSEIDPHPLYTKKYVK